MKYPIYSMNGQLLFPSEEEYFRVLEAADKVFEGSNALSNSFLALTEFFYSSMRSPNFRWIDDQGIYKDLEEVQNIVDRIATKCKAGPHD